MHRVVVAIAPRVLAPLRVVVPHLALAELRGLGAIAIVAQVSYPLPRPTLGAAVVEAVEAGPPAPLEEVDLILARGALAGRGNATAIEVVGLPAHEPRLDGCRISGLGAPPDTVLLPDDALVARFEYAIAGREDVTSVPRRLRVRIDAERRVVDVLWVAAGPVSRRSGADLDRVVVSLVAAARWSEADPEERWDDVLCELPRGHFVHAATADEVKAGARAPALEEDELAMHRYGSWGHPIAPSPTMRVERFARISAELGERSGEREKVLQPHGLTEYDWSVEERAYADILGSDYDEEDPDADDVDADPDREPTAQVYARELAAAQEGLASPSERARGAAEYAQLAVAMETGDPSKVLGEAGLSLGAWMRLERRILGAAAADPAAQRELDAAIARARETAPQTPPLDVDDDVAVRALLREKAKA